MMADFHCLIITMILLFIAEASAQSLCVHGELRLVDGCVPNEGRVEICTCMAASCSWGTVCDDQWDDKDAQVVCRQLGYGSDGAQALSAYYYFGRGRFCQSISLDDVMCDANEMKLLDCEHDGLLMHNCHHYEDAGVRCTGGLDSNSSLQSVKNIMNVSVNVTSIVSIQGINLYTILITWKLQNISYQLQPSMYQIECLSNQHRIAMSANNTTFSVQLVGLLPSTSYNCCVSATYKAYTPKGICVEIVMIESSETSITQLDLCETVGRASSSAADTIGGVLGFVIIILLTLLAVSGVALVYLLRPRIFRRVLPKHHEPVDRNSNNVPVRRNVNCANTASHSTISGSQGVQGAAGQNETDTGAAADYSRIGPSYETIDSRRQQQQPAVAVMERDQVSQARLSERYEFSEPHLAAMISAGGSGGTQGEAAAAMDYEVPLQSGQHEEYSHLQH